jgi:hypothetical protein
MSEIVLGEFSSQTLEPHEGPHGLWPHGADQIVQRGLAAGVPLQLRTPEDLHREQIRVARQDLSHQWTKWLRLRGAANGAPLTFRGLVDVRDVWLSVDPTDASKADADESGHLGLRVSRLS